MAGEPRRDALRVRRYVGATLDDLELVDEYELDAGNVEIAAVADAEWSDRVAGRTWRIVIDDPAGDLDAALVVEGHAVEWQDDRDQDHEDDRAALGWDREP